MATLFCIVCNAQIAGRRFRYCSKRCESKYHTAKYERINGPRLQVASATVGAINEYLVGIDLLKRGLAVFRALSPASPGDLAVLHGNKLLMVEVTTGTKTPSGSLMYPPHKKQTFDIIAIVERSGNINYIPDLPITETASS